MEKKLITIKSLVTVIEDFYREFQLEKTQKIEYKEFRNFLDKNGWQLDEKTFLLFVHKYGESLKKEIKADFHELA